MIGFDVDTELEKAYAKYKRIGLFMPNVVKDFNNRMAFNTRALAKKNLRSRIVVRSGSFKFITGGRVLSVKQARFSRNVERIMAEVGGRIVPQARDPHFMARLEFGGSIPAGRFGQTAIPTVKGARRGSLPRNIGRRNTVPPLSAQAVSARNVKGSPRQKRAIALSVAINERKNFVKMRDTRGRMSIYKVKGRGRGRNRRISEVTKLWTLSDQRHGTSPTRWLSNAVRAASAQRGKVFNRVAEYHIRRRALRGK